MLRKNNNLENGKALVADRAIVGTEMISNPKTGVDMLRRERRNPITRGTDPVPGATPEGETYR